MAKSKPPTQQRTLVIGAGQVGTATVQNFQARVLERWGDIPTVACLAVTAEGTVTGLAGELPILELPMDTGSDTREQARQLLRAHTDDLLPILLGRLAELSRPSGPLSGPASGRPNADRTETRRSRPRPHLRRTNLAGGSLPEIVICLVAALDDPIGGGTLLDLAHLVRQLIHQRLNAVPVTTGLLLLPDGLALADPEPALARAHATLHEIDAVRNRWGRSPDGALSGSVGPVHSAQPVPRPLPRPLLSDVLSLSKGLSRGLSKVSKQALSAADGSRPDLLSGSPFNGGCYLLGTTDAAGWRMDQPDERIAFASEALVQLVLSPLDELCQNHLSAWSTDQRLHNYATIGLASWVFPRQTAADLLAHRLATEVLEAWLADSAVEAEGAGADAVAFLAEHSLDPGSVMESLLPYALLEETGLTRLAEPQVSLSGVRRLRQAMEDDAADRLEILAERRPAMDEAADALGRWLAAVARADVVQQIDRPEPGRLSAGEALLAGIETHLETQRTELENIADTHWTTLERIDAELDRVGQEIEKLGARFPEPRIGALVRILVSPHRLLRLALSYRQLTHALTTYRSLCIHKMDTVFQVLRRDLAVRAYDAALENLREQRTHLTRLEQVLCQAHELVDAELSRKLGNLREGGSTFEYSLLTPTVLDQLYALVSTDPGEMLAKLSEQLGSLSRWLGNTPDAAGVRDACLVYARQRCQVVESLSITQVLLNFHGLGDVTAKQGLLVTTPGAGQKPVPDDTRWSIREALYELSETAIPFLTWDETQLAEAEREGLQVTTMLGTAEGTASPLLGDAGELPWSFIMTTGDATRITALTVVRGLPLKAIVGLPTPPPPRRACPEIAEGGRPGGDRTCSQ